MGLKENNALEFHSTGFDHRPVYRTTCKLKENKFHACIFNPCKNGGTCKIKNGKVVCDCRNSYSGEKCDQDACTPNPCKNGGICKIQYEKAVCYCPDPFVGDLCEKDRCTSDPCKNGGTCKIKDGKVVCNCPDPYSGDTCESDPCSSDPCKNGGTCKVRGEKAVCYCPDLYSGERCETECKCENGWCRRDVATDAYSCNCHSEFGLYAEGVCKACNCGKDSNCTFDRRGNEVQKFCICPKGFEEKHGICNDIDDSWKMYVVLLIAIVTLVIIVRLLCCCQPIKKAYILGFSEDDALPCHREQRMTRR
ncbi:delta-like protein C [Stegodyphus dumicola]|uniref:delta-like protein C n=1 Tax=Stegodyphus dumicola TaxID=202533 RepID=UPI0015A935B5|nr:delta-like protein C [Stegodyphus dumicola]